ncbi:phosphoenolpyruvate carboxykinase domain-containing protein [Salinibacterium xinjiangense]|uniref:phosphoenolpyruvate carboxykinase domain-containing protein n=1 Tax=Salinibacterium xinjiangense TaxID=386302 RepID=UPI001E4E201A|nr:phosphoenolpyruvate carboxykinase domain-containing protein [Salinibacterium xinjiangense]
MGANSQTNRRISRWPLKDSATETPQGVIIVATNFGGRDATNVPLVVEARE